MSESAVNEPSPALPNVERLLEDNRRWRGRCVGACVALGFLFVVSLVQFVGTFIGCRVMYEARVEAQRLHERTVEGLKIIQQSQERTEQAERNLHELEKKLAEKERELSRADSRER